MESDATQTTLTYAQAAARYQHAPGDPDVHAALFAEIERLRAIAHAILEPVTQDFGNQAMLPEKAMLKYAKAQKLAEEWRRMS